jgi:hypothetical protein
MHCFTVVNITAGPEPAVMLPPMSSTPVNAESPHKLFIGGLPPYLEEEQVCVSVCLCVCLCVCVSVCLCVCESGRARVCGVATQALYWRPAAVPRGGADVIVVMGVLVLMVECEWECVCV